MSKAFVKEVEAKEELMIEEVTKKEVPVITKTAIGVFYLKKKMYRLMSGDDKNWYKQEAIGKTRIDPIHGSPEIVVWDKEITPITKKEFESYFGKK